VGDGARRAERPLAPFTDEQRLAFGRVAELYDRWRPSYPAAAIDAVLDYGGLTAGTPIVEVGAGTGKATELLAERGLAVLAIEPSADMARLARTRCAAHPEVQVVESEFEDWAPPERRQALVSAAAWHWIDPAVRFARAHAALVPGGTLAAMWSFPDWERCAAREPLRQAYRRAAPALAADFPMHPDSDPTRLAGDWEAEIEAGGLFADPIVLTFPWCRCYASREYVGLLQTHQDHILLADGDRAELLTAIERTVDSQGGTIELPLITYVCLARRR
jgi:SAM-dependent methyltransferase